MHFTITLGFEHVHVHVQLMDLNVNRFDIFRNRV